MNKIERSALEALAANWANAASRALTDAKNESTEMGRRLVEHGGMCYFNCVQELRRVLDASGPLPSATEEARQK